jgi:hypothetical protein
LGITIGYADHTFRPSRAVSRQEMATFITRTLAHTNTRPAGLVSQARGNRFEGYDIQVSLRDADFAPLPNTPIDAFGTNYPDDVFDAADGSCDGRFTIGLQPSFTACEIDPGDIVTDDFGNVEYIADPPDIGIDPILVACGTTSEAEGATDDFPAGDPARFDEAHSSWAWTGNLSDEVDEDTDLVQTVVFADSRRPRALPPYNAEVGGGLDPRKNQLEARMGQVVEYTVQLLADPVHRGPMGERIAVGPDASGNKYVLVVTRSLHAYDVTLDDPQTTDVNEASRTKRPDDASTEAVDERIGATISISPSVVEPNDDGTITIPITQSDPDATVNNDDVFVSFVLTPIGTVVDAPGYNGARGADGNSPFEDVVDDTDTADVNEAVAYIDRVLFSDDGPDPSMYVLKAETAPYRIAPGSGRANNYVSITVIDHYGRPVRGFPVNAVSDQDGVDATGGDVEGEGRSTLPFVQYFTTRSNGSYSVGYSYSGDALTETLRAFGHEGRPNRDTDRTVGSPGLEEPNSSTALADPLTAGSVVLDENGDLADPTSLVPPQPANVTLRAAEAVTTHWSDIGTERAAPNTPYDGDGILVVDVENKTFVVRHAADGPQIYTWDDVDTFSISGEPISIELFEAILTTHLETQAGENPKRPRDVTLSTLDWSSYDYNRPVDRANWIITTLCEPRGTVAARNAQPG